MDEKEKKDKSKIGNNGNGSAPAAPPSPAAGGGNGNGNGNGHKGLEFLAGLVPYHSLEDLKKNPPPKKPATPSLHPFDKENYYTSKPEKPETEESKAAASAEAEYNAAIIQAAFLELVKEKKRFPQFKELRDRTGLSFSVVNKYVKKIKFQDQSSPLKVLTPLVLLNLTNQALDPKAPPYVIMAWLKVVAGWVEKTETTATNRIDFRETLHTILELKDDADRAKRLSGFLNATNQSG